MASEKTTADLTARGFIEIAEDGDPLWKFIRGGWMHRWIEEAVVGPDGQSVWIKLGGPEDAGDRDFALDELPPGQRAARAKENQNG